MTLLNKKQSFIEKAYVIIFEHKKASKKGETKFSIVTLFLFMSLIHRPLHTTSSSLFTLHININNSKNQSRPCCPNFGQCGRNNTATHHTLDSRGPSPMSTSITCTHCFNGADSNTATTSHTTSRSHLKRPSRFVFCPTLVMICNHDAM